MLNFFFGNNQKGGAKCSLCGSEGTNKSTCPLNPSAINPNPTKHPKAMAILNKTTKGATNGAKKIKKQTKKETFTPSYLATLPEPALESMVEQGILSYEDLSALRQSAKGTKVATEQASVKKLAQKIKPAPVNDKTQKKFPVVIKDPEDPNLPPLVLNKDEFLEAWVPIVKPYSSSKEESPYDEKILGSPLFFEGDQWPKLDGEPLSFYAQFYDPNPNSPLGKDFIQIYIRDIQNIDGGSKDASIRKISQKDILSKKPIIPPKVETNREVNEEIIKGGRASHLPQGKSGKIVGWDKIDTISWQDILDKGEEYSQDSFEKSLDDLNIGTGGGFGNLLQIGGVPSSWQGGEKDYVADGAYLNELYNGYWGDAGSLHYTTDGYILGDMA